jgi:hypothetical protein
MIPEFVADWMQKQPKTNFPADIASFLKQFQISDALFSQFLDWVGKQKPALKKAELQKSKSELRLHLKARIARSLFQDMGLYSVFNDDDPAVEKAVQLLNSAAPIK